MPTLSFLSRRIDYLNVEIWPERLVMVVKALKKSQNKSAERHY